MTDARPLKLSRQANAFVYLLVAAAALLYYQFAYVSARRSLAGIGQSIATEGAELDKSRTQLAALSGRQPAAAPANMDEDGAADLAETAADANTGFAEVIETLAKGDGGSPFALNRIVTEKRDTANGYDRTLFSVDVEASFPAIGGFLEGLERSPLLTEVRSVEISRIGGELARCSAKVKLFSYVVKR